MTHIRTLLEHEQRVVKELSELAENINKLSAFLENKDSKNTCSDKEFDRLTRQETAMKSYAAILHERVVAFVEERT